MPEVQRDVRGAGEMIDEHELFLESHRELLGVLRWLNKPIILVERGSTDMDTVEAMLNGADIAITRDNDGIKLLRGGHDEALVETVLKTVCESHLRLK